MDTPNPARYSASEMLRRVANSLEILSEYLDASSPAMPEAISETENEIISDALALLNGSREKLETLANNIANSLRE